LASIWAITWHREPIVGIGYLAPRTEANVHKRRINVYRFTVVEGQDIELPDQSDNR
jgi:hypothetical protein